MKIGVPKEIKNNEYRVGMTPAAVRELTARGHTVFVETKAGDAIDLTDEMYTRGRRDAFCRAPPKSSPKPT